MILKSLTEAKPESISDKMSTSNTDDIMTSEQASAKKWYHQLSTWIKITLGLSVVSLIILSIIERETTVQLATDFLVWMEQDLFIGYVTVRKYNIQINL